jgi:DNA-binding Xre family transcriptional regulator
VREVANDRGITTITALAEKADLAYDTARDLWHGRMQRVDRDVLQRVCLALRCTPGDLLVLDEVEKDQTPDLAELLLLPA